jgi:hypothetical protein
MRLYPDWEPESVTLKGTLSDGTEISKEYHYVDKYLYMKDRYNTINDIKQQFCTHNKCECGKIYEKDYYAVCPECRAKKNKEKYLALSVVELSFPCFVNDVLCMDFDNIECYIEDNEIKNPEELEIHPAVKVNFNFDIFDYIDSWESDNGLDDPIDFFDKDKNVLRHCESEINKIVNSSLNWYEANTKVRMEYK